MSRYRQQGSDQAVRLIFRPGLGLTETKALTIGGLLLFGVAVVVSREVIGTDRDEALGVAAMVTAAALAVLVALLRYVHEITVDHEQVRLRYRHFPLLWSERRLPRSAIERLESDPLLGGRVRLVLRLRQGVSVPLLDHLEVDPDTASQLAQTLERALDPDHLDDLAAEHRGGATGRT